MKLSPRETQVDKLAASGLTTAEIAASLEIAEGTVMLHKRKIRMVKAWIAAHEPTQQAEQK